MVEQNNIEDNIQIAEPNQFQFNKQEGFSHQLSVQKAYYKVEESLAKEMVEGLWQEIRDKHGNSKSIYLNDTRRESIESIKTLKNVMIADLKGTIYSDTIKLLLNRIEKIKIEFLREQISWWNSLTYEHKKDYIKNHKSFNPNYLYDKLPYYHDNLNKQVDVYRSIFEQLELCLAERKYLKKFKQTNLVNDEGYQLIDG